ncbi:hypothetical protein PV783_17320 [Chitinophaga sp. CC14]|uniref:Uncharacterized protein n=1 Tax=Chitinophaga defluvii TaxID=3163343 RepID=A0ABV2T498_9BACT
MATKSKLKLIQQSTHYLKVRQDRVPPFIMEGSYVFAEKVEANAISLKPDIFLVSFLNGGKRFIKGQRKNGNLLFSDIRSGRAVPSYKNEINGIYRLKLVSDTEVDIPVHLKSLHDQIS